MHHPPPTMHCPILSTNPRPVVCSTQHPHRAGSRPAGRAWPPPRPARGTWESRGLPSPCPPSRLCPAAAKPSSTSRAGARGPGAVCRTDLGPLCLSQLPIACTVGAELHPPPALSSIYKNTLLWKWDVQELSVQYKPTSATQPAAHRHATVAPEAHPGVAVRPGGAMAPTCSWAWH